MRKQDLDYYRLRAAQERSLADRSDDRTARSVHLEMAARYSALLREPPPHAGTIKASPRA